MESIQYKCKNYKIQMEIYNTNEKMYNTNDKYTIEMERMKWNV